MYDITIDFKAGTVQYRAGERVSADDFTEDQRTRYVANGWMAPAGEEAKPLPVGAAAELTVENITTATANKGV